MFFPSFFLVLNLARERVLSDKRCRACSHVASSTLLTDSDTELTYVSDPGEAVGISDEDEPNPATAAPSADQATVVIHTNLQRCFHAHVDSVLI